VRGFDLGGVLSWGGWGSASSESLDDTVFLGGVRNLQSTDSTLVEVGGDEAFIEVRLNVDDVVKLNDQVVTNPTDPTGQTSFFQWEMPATTSANNCVELDMQSFVEEFNV